MLLCAWLGGPLYSVPRKLSINHIEDGTCYQRWPDKDLHTFAGVVNTCLYLFIPVGIMVFVGVSILRVLNNRMKVKVKRQDRGQGQKSGHGKESVVVSNL